MIRTIMALFGYTKIPKAVVQLSMLQEDFAKRMHQLCGDLPFPAAKKEIQKELLAYTESSFQAQKTLTNFLRSGKLLNKE